jgi:precorrin-6A/cobalt-precorrin-6A reductase
MMRLLILGGTTEASLLAQHVATRTDLTPLLSLAGRTRHPATPPIPFRMGGFGGVDGLIRFLVENAIDLVVDATHPFAAQMTRHAAMACSALNLPLAIFTRPEWIPEEGDRWTRVGDMQAAVAALGPDPRRVFLTIGGLQLAAFAAAPWHHYVIRAIEPPQAAAGLPHHDVILARGPYRLADEVSLMRDASIDSLVTKNSGGTPTGAKLHAARMLGIEVVMIDRPPIATGRRFDTLEAVTGWIDDHRATP